MRYLSVIRQKSLTERKETDTCPLTDSKRVHVIDRFLCWSIFLRIALNRQFDGHM